MIQKTLHFFIAYGKFFVFFIAYREWKCHNKCFISLSPLGKCCIFCTFALWSSERNLFFCSCQRQFRLVGVPETWPLVIYTILSERDKQHHIILFYVPVLYFPFFVAKYICTFNQILLYVCKLNLESRSSPDLADDKKNAYCKQDLLLATVQFASANTIQDLSAKYFHCLILFSFRLSPCLLSLVSFGLFRRTTPAFSISTIAQIDYAYPLQH